MKHKDKKTIFYNLIFSLGHVYTATGDYANALASHKQCVELIRSQLEDKLMVRSMKYTKENKKELKSLFAHYVFHLFEVTKKFILIFTFSNHASFLPIYLLPICPIIILIKLNISNY